MFRNFVEYSRRLPIGLGLVVLVLIFASSGTAAEKLRWIKPPLLTFNATSQTHFVEFHLSDFTDVEIAIVEPRTGAIVRHLAAGVLGPKVPPPFAPNSLLQKIEWDGKDDYRTPVPRTDNLSVRVRAGMRVVLEQIAGGDPYAFYSEESGHNDHSPFGINGLEAKADGTIYVLGHSSNLGPPAVRQYDRDGNYLRTVFPPPAGKDTAAMQGWGLNIKPDGTYTPKFNRLTDPSVAITFLDTATNGMARLLPTPAKTQLTFWDTGLGTGSFDRLIINSGSTIPANLEDRLPGPMVKEPPLELGPISPNSHINQSLLGPVFTCFSADGKHFYLSGVYAATTRYGSIQDIKSTGTWRDGQLWKVDATTLAAQVIFSLPKETIPTNLNERKGALGGTHSYATLHGVAVDKEGNIFLCDRLNKRVVVLDKEARIIRELPVEFPDAIAISERTGALYATTRFGDEHVGRGKVTLLKFADWRRDTVPKETLSIAATGYTDHHKSSLLALCETEQATNVWVATTELPVRVYRDLNGRLELIKDFYHVPNAQRCLGFDRIDVDTATEDVYLLDDHTGVWRIRDWKKPVFQKTPLRTASITIDARQRQIYTRTLADGSSSNSVGKIACFKLDDDFSPVSFGNPATNRLTPAMKYEWCFTGNGDKGFAIAPNGNIAVVGDPQDGLRLFAGTSANVPWEATLISQLPHRAGGVQFDFAGNLYVGYVDQKSVTPLPGFEKDRFADGIGRIHKFTPTGTLASGNLFPTAPVKPSLTYDIPYGAFDTDCITRTPRFDVDGFGRIYYPTNIAQRIAIIDNAGNEILHFGTYGNRDSLGGLPGDLISTSDIPMAFPNSVAVTDNYVYVGDMVNQRLLRLRKKFALEGPVP